MFDLLEKAVFVKTQDEYKNLLRMAKLQGFKLTDDLKAEIPLPNILFFNGNKIIAKLNSDEARIIYEASEILNANTEKEMTAREFLEKLIIKYINCSGRGCENCKLCMYNNKLEKQLCDSNLWKTDDIDYLIELVSDDDPIYHPPIENVKAANFIDDVLGGKELSKDEEEALKYAAEKLRKMKENE